MYTIHFYLLIKLWVILDVANKEAYLLVWVRKLNIYLDVLYFREVGIIINHLNKAFLFRNTTSISLFKSKWNIFQIALCCAQYILMYDKFKFKYICYSQVSQFIYTLPWRYLSIQKNLTISMGFSRLCLKTYQYRVDFVDGHKC